MPGTTSTALPSFSHDQHHKTDAAKRKGGEARGICKPTTQLCWVWQLQMNQCNKQHWNTHISHSLTVLCSALKTCFFSGLENIQITHVFSFRKPGLKSLLANESVGLYSQRCLDWVISWSLHSSSLVSSQSAPLLTTHTHTHTHTHTASKLVSVLRHFQHKQAISCQRSRKCIT